MKKFLACTTLLLVFLVCLGGCDVVDTLKNGFAHSEAVSTELERTLGVKSFVGFNWNNGSLTSVSVNFNGVPANHALADIVAAAKKAVVAEFKETPDEIVVSFSIKS